MPKKTVILLFGGQSTEHEISCRSAAFVAKNLNHQIFDLTMIGIDNEGGWHLQQRSPTHSSSALTVLKGAFGEAKNPSGEGRRGPFLPENLDLKNSIVFPMIHGTTGEDGTVQGFLEFMNVPYVGSDVLGSALAMNKHITKIIAQSQGIPVVPWLTLDHSQWQAMGENGLAAQIDSKLNWPVFVKPCSLGSSVGVSKVKSVGELKKACETALNVDERILVERGVRAREIECAVVGDLEPRATRASEIVPKQEFYSYDAKYNDPNGAEIVFPAPISEKAQTQVQKYAAEIFKHLMLHGLARVDFFIDAQTEQLYLNEVNTMPGFTDISQFPTLWKHEGVGASDLLEKLIAFAEARHRRKSSLKRQMKAV